MNHSGTTSDRRQALVRLSLRMVSGASGPLISFIALFALPLLGALVLDTEQFAFWAILASISTVALSLDFGGVALLTARFHAERRGRLLWRCSLLSAAGALAVGVVALLAWSAVGTTMFASSVPMLDALLAIGAMTVATAIRSAMMVIAQAALMDDDLVLRNVTTAGHAVLATVVTVTTLFVWQTYWALPLGWLASGILLLPACAIAASRSIRRSTFSPTIEQQVQNVRFGAIRTVATILGSILLQADKWVVGIIGGPAVLAVYEVAWRFANLPRFLVQNLAIRVGADGATFSSSDGAELRRLLRHSTLICVVAAVVAIGAVTPAYFLFNQFGELDSNAVLFIAMILTFSLLSLTAPWSFAGVALGRAGIDVPYVVVALFVACLGAFSAAATDDVWIFVTTYLSGLILSTAVFAAYAPRMIRTGLTTRRKLQKHDEV